ncbi:acetyltransferase (GNAT) family protein [Yokenella regensburgei]|uniref:Acetyltransferase (GNAT) family protein n=1 Tax=Yokenella regensburgei TaxID=158877 RepID=A0AB38G2N9_9ENTR|nr:acetyltransferase (GNAT) family protein [Yokenella regensburgei]SQA65510.1 Predicted acetyltransferase [Yokenella regensburgei]SQA95961.1 Predicted acetyltransferase [Yokenella regensburgei]SUQ04086.1 Predicted acetyltransferase [Yokenella regensburgei]VFS12533.1 Predicted acetyltransferase [Yokenella regensburgei]
MGESAKIGALCRLLPGVSVKIQPLHLVPHHAECVTDWLWQAFGDPLSREVFASIINHSQQPDSLPLTFVATEGDTLLGTVGLWRCDLISRQDLFPWMGALYVSESARGQGLAGKLQQHVLDYAREMGFASLHLYSACRDFYERFGWQYIGDGLDYPDTTVHLYRYDLSPSASAMTE